MRDKWCARRRDGRRSDVEARADQPARRVMAGASIAIATAVFAWTVLPVLPAGADLSALSPASGTVVGPGESTTFSLVSGDHCVRATSDDSTISVSVDNKGDCGDDVERTLVVAVATAVDTPPGVHVITVTEIGVQGGQGQSVAWSFTVAAAEAPTTTSTTDSTTTSSPPTSSTSLPDDSTTVASSATSSTSHATPDVTVGPGGSSATSTAPGAGDPTTSTTPTRQPAAGTEEPANGDDGAPETDGDSDRGAADTEGEVPEDAGDDGGDVVVRGGVSPDSGEDPELSGLAAGDFTRALTGEAGPAFDGLSLADFLHPFGEDGGAPPKPRPAPLLPWATRVLVVFTLADVVRARDKTLQVG